jgi:hypothetical protein
MSRARIVPIIAAVTTLLAPAPALAKERRYQVVSGTTTVTLNNAWVASLYQQDGQLSASGGAHFTVSKPKNAPPIYRITLPVRKQRGTGFSYGTSQGTLVSFAHGGTVTISSPADNVTLNFEQPRAEFAPSVSGGANDRLVAMLTLPTGSGPTTLLLARRMSIPRPRGGYVTMRKNDVKYDYTGAGAEWYLDGDDALINLPMGDLKMRVRVK